MSFIGDMFSGSKGAGFQAQGAQIKNPLEDALSRQWMGNVSDSLRQQQELATAAGVGGNQAMTSQQQLLGQLGQQAQGEGPNPALAQLANTTGQNISQQASLMAGQRGAASNPALLARMASQQGSQANQQAAGQAAVLRAQQQIAAQQQLGQQQAQMFGQQSNALGNLTQGNLNVQGNVLGTLGGYNQALVGNQSGVNQANSNIAAQNAKGQWGILEKVGGAGGAALGMADGGQVPGPSSFVGKHVAKMSSGGNVADYRSGGHIPGKAKVAGDSLKNDTVPAILSPGEVVIPRSVMKSKNPTKGAADFVNAILAKQQMKRKAI